LREILVLSKIDPTMISNARELAAKQGLTDLLKYAVIVVASAPVMALYPFVQKYFVRGVMIGAVKG
jgi:ABC-type glycerol-3-phosphate transport system permease component